MRIELYNKGEVPPEFDGTAPFHSVTLFHIFEKTQGVEPVLLMAYDDDGNPIGRLLGVIKNKYKWFPPFYFKLCSVYGLGDYFNPNKILQEEVFTELLKKLIDALNSRCFVIEFRNLESPLFAYRQFRRNGFFPVAWLRIYNSLHNKTPLERLSKQYKSYVRKALKNGAVAQIANTEEDLDQTLLFFNKYFASRSGRYFPNTHFFKQVYSLNEKRENLQVFYVKYLDKIIGGSICFFYEKRAYLLFSCGLRKSYPLQHPGIMAVWEAINYAHKHNYDHFEFLDAGMTAKRQIGYLRFILNFGGKQMSSRRWYRVSWRWLNKILEKIYV